MDPLLSTRLTTPIGNMLGCSTVQGVCLLEFEERKDLEAQLKSLQTHTGAKIVPGINEHLRELQIQLDKYFAEELTAFNLPLHLLGTDFQKQVWEVLLGIPFGATRTYMDVTKQLGDPKAIRAVAGINAANKIALVVPCHRVVGSDGKLVGYAGGLWRKQWLLDHERNKASKQTSLDF